MRQSNKFLIVSLSACLSSAAIAQTCGEEKWRGSCTDDAPNFAGWYVGEGLGIGRANLKLGATNLLQSKNTLASNFHAGYNWALRDSDIILGVVGNYSSLRAINYSVNSAWSGFNSRPKIGENDYGLSLLVGFPVKQWMYHVKVGYGHTRSTGDYRTTNQDWLFGLGVQYKLNESWSVGADYDDTRGRAKKDDKAISTSRTVTLSLRYYLDADLEKRSQVTSLNEDIMYPSLPKDASTTVKETTLKTTPASDTAEAADDTATKTNAGDANNNLVTPAAQPKNHANCPAQ